MDDFSLKLYAEVGSSTPEKWVKLPWINMVLSLAKSTLVALL